MTSNHILIPYTIKHTTNEENERREQEQEQGKKSTFKDDGAKSNFVADEDSRKDDQYKKQK